MKIKDFLFSILLVLFTLTLFTNCTDEGSFLTEDADDEFTLHNVMQDSIKVMGLQAKPYRHIMHTYYSNDDFYNGRVRAWSDLGDDSRPHWEISQTGAPYNKADLSNPNDSRMKNHWVIAYQNIVRLNNFIDKVEGFNFQGEFTKKRLQAESRVLRAWYYYHLVRLYGGVPLLGDVIPGLDTKGSDFPRKSFQETVDYIVSECQAVVDSGDLPESYEGNEYGRVTSGAAMALKARVLLLAASPLHNTQTAHWSADVNDYLAYPAYDKERWKLAADAQKAIIDLDRYKLVVDETTPGRGFYKMQVERVNTEYIFQLMKTRGNKLMEGAYLPTSRGGSVYSKPFQNFVDAFLTADGHMIPQEKLSYPGLDQGQVEANVKIPEINYDDSKPYSNRDPRLKYTILHHKSNWMNHTGENKPSALDFSEDSKTEDLKGTLTTRYAFRKFCDESATTGRGTNNGCLPIIRYAEILLNYAEALMEYDYEANKNAVDDALIQIRKRAGINAGADSRYGVPANATQDEMRKIIRNERRIELALEGGIRFFDLKRWFMLKEVKDNAGKYACRWEKKDGKDVFYRVLFEKHSYAKKLYFFPIPQSEIDKLSFMGVPQNPGW